MSEVHSAAVAGSPYPSAIAESRAGGLLPRASTHYVTKHLQQGNESDYFRVKRAIPCVGGFRPFNTARRTIQGFEAMLWLRKGFGFAGAWTVGGLPGGREALRLPVAVR